MMNILIDFTNSAADRWAAWVVATSLDAALLLGMIGLIWGAIRNRVAPQVGYLLFLLVPLKLLVPVVVTLPAEFARCTPSALMSSWFRSAPRARADREPACRSNSRSLRPARDPPRHPNRLSPRARSHSPWCQV